MSLLMGSNRDNWHPEELSFGMNDVLTVFFLFVIVFFGAINLWSYRGDLASKGQVIETEENTSAVTSQNSTNLQHQQSDQCVTNICNDWGCDTPLDLAKTKKGCGAPLSAQEQALILAEEPCQDEEY